MNNSVHPGRVEARKKVLRKKNFAGKKRQEGTTEWHLQNCPVCQVQNDLKADEYSHTQIDGQKDGHVSQQCVLHLHIFKNA